MGTTDTRYLVMSPHGFLCFYTEYISIIKSNAHIIFLFACTNFLVSTNIKRFVGIKRFNSSNAAWHKYLQQLSQK